MTAKFPAFGLALALSLVSLSVLLAEDVPLQEPVKPAQERVEPAVAPVEEEKAPVKPEEKTVSEIKELTGEITGLSGSFIAITSGTTAEGAGLESAFNVPKDVRMAHKRSFKELRQGDTVTVRYEEVRQSFADGRTMRKNTVKSITFLKAAPKVTQSEALTTPAEEPEGSLPLKGIRGR